VYATVTAEEADRAAAKAKPPKFPKPSEAEPVTAWADDYLWQKAGSVVGVVMRRTPLPAGTLVDRLPDGLIGLSLELTGPAADLRFSAKAVCRGHGHGRSPSWW
jgi:hypothetical protein